MWEYEFAGYIWGEGNLGLYTYKRRKKDGTFNVFFRPMVAVTARQDDLKVLEHLKNELGGYIYVYKDHKRYGAYKSHPVASWKISDVSGVRKIMDILSNANFPSKKKQLIPLFYEYLDIIKGTGHKLHESEKKRIFEIIDEMKAIRSYSEQ
jgi:hypothetical protein